MGIAKARRLERHLATLLPQDVPPPRPLFALSATPALFGAPSPAHTSRAPDTQTDEASSVRVWESVTQTALSRPLLEADSDRQAVQSWI